ncbi:MAG: CPBP family intramembrane metalloprotease [Firmicutes bacterium]|nr:CPBP family intramembrane metalloprotease [Bacillota bacterium]
MKKNIVSILSPLIIIILGFLTAKVFSTFMYEWTFLPVSLIYWAALLFFTKRKNINIKDMFNKPRESKNLLIVLLIFSLIPFLNFILNIGLLNNLFIIIIWLLFSILNPLFEEVYWRGVLLNTLPFRKKWIAIFYSTLLFVLSHKLIWGVFSIGYNSLLVTLMFIIMGIVWSIIYLKTKSLWYCYISHVLIDLFSLSVFMLLNLYIPLV